MTDFKKQTGMCIADYVKKARADHALDDYLTKNVPVCEAALKNGFGHYNRFTIACNKIYGAGLTATKKMKRGKAVSLPLEIPA